MSTTTPGGAVVTGGRHIAALRSFRFFCMLSCMFMLLAAIACGPGSDYVAGPEAVATWSAEELASASIGMVSGDDQSGPAGSVIGSLLVIEVTDSVGAPLGGVPVEWTFAHGRGSSNASPNGAARVSEVTDDLGRSSIRWELGQRAGVQLAYASIVENAPATAGGPSAAPPWQNDNGNGKKVGFRARAQAGAAAAIAVLPSSPTVPTADTVRLTAEVTDAYGNVISGATVQWQSEDEGVVIVDGGGLASGVTEGSADVMVSSGSLMQVSSVSVVDGTTTIVTPSPVTDLRLAATDQGSLTVRWTEVSDGAGGTLAYALRMETPSVSWAWAGASQVTVAGTGAGNTLEHTFSGLLAGTDYQVQVASYHVAAPGDTVYSAPSAPVSATTGAVAPVVTTVDVSPAGASLSVGDTVRFVATVRDDGGNVMSGGTVQWYTTNGAVVTVGPTGLATAIAAGTAAVGARVDGVQGEQPVTVTAPAQVVTSVQVSPTTVTVAAGDSFAFSAAVRDQFGAVMSGMVVQWTSSNNAVMTMDASGMGHTVTAGAVQAIASVMGVQGRSDVTVTSVGGGVTAPTDTMAFHDFETGGMGPYTNPWGSGVDFVSDPTGSGRGTVARIRYAPSSGNSQERALQYSTPSQIRYGAFIGFSGDVYMPASPGPQHNRKLLDYQGSNVRMTLHRRGGELRLSLVDAFSGTQRETVAVGTGIMLPDNQWHHLEVRLWTNTRSGVRDGRIEIYYNGTLAFTIANVGWITDQVSSYFRNLLVGFQLTIDSGDSAYAEYRYWDNVGFYAAP